MEWLGHAKVSFDHAPKAAPLRRRDGQLTDVARVVRDATPPCHLNPLLFNGHLQTMWTATKQHGPPIYYKRRVFEAEPPNFKGSFAVDFVDEPFEGSEEADAGVAGPDPTLPPRTAYLTDAEFADMPSSDSRPMLVVLHGLSGGSHEIYLRHAIAPLVEGGDWEMCVVNSRGCANSRITSGILYNARTTWDIRQVVKWLRSTFPNRPLFGLGFSLGANMLTNYCGEEGPDCLLKAAVICANPFNLDVANKALKRTFLGKEVYQRAMGQSLKELANGHRKELAKFTDLDLKRLRRVTYVCEFDREVQYPTWGYPTEDAYYRDASSVDSVLAIKIPFLAIHAKDDPIAVDEAIPYAEFRLNPHTVLLSTSMGGHLCYFEIGGGRWFAKPVCNFLNAMAFQIDLDSVLPKTSTFQMVGNGDKGQGFDPMRRKMSLMNSI